LGLGGADEGAQKLTLHLGGNGIDIDAGLAQEVASVFNVVVASGFEGDSRKACS
jgi:hypothetical protein